MELIDTWNINRYKCKVLHNARLDIYEHCQILKYTNPSLISSPEPKAQVSFSNQNLSVVRRRHCRRRWRKLFTFLSSSPEPLGQFQPNLAQSILG